METVALATRAGDVTLAPPHEEAMEAGPQRSQGAELPLGTQQSQTGREEQQRIEDGEPATNKWFLIFWMGVKLAERGNMIVHRRE